VSLSQACGLISPNIGQPYTETDYTRFQQWNLNAIVYEVFWTHLLEPDELQPGIYDAVLLEALDRQIELAQRHGLYTFLAPRVSFNPEDPKSWYGWADRFGYDYVNFNQLDASGTAGRDRYVDVFRMLSQRYPDVGFCVTFYPYHHQSATDPTQIVQFYNVTLPLLYTTLRNFTDEYLIINLIHQGYGESLTTGQYLVIEDFGYPFTDDPKLLYGFNNHDGDDNMFVARGGSWDYNTSQLTRNYEPLLAFQSKYHVSFACVEGFALDVHLDATSRPIETSRLGWVQAQLEIMNTYQLGWFYFTYENPPYWASPVEEDGSDNAIASLLQQYASVPLEED
jgi:hypothetical protein